MDKLNENYQHNRRGNAAGCVATSHINALVVLSRDRAYYALFLNKHLIYIKGKGLINQGFSGINCKKMQSFFVSEFMEMIISSRKNFPLKIFLAATVILVFNIFLISSSLLTMNVDENFRYQKSSRSAATVKCLIIVRQRV